MKKILFLLAAMITSLSSWAEFLITVDDASLVRLTNSNGEVISLTDGQNKVEADEGNYTISSTKEGYRLVSVKAYGIDVSPVNNSNYWSLYIDEAEEVTITAKYENEISFISFNDAAAIKKVESNGVKMDLMTGGEGETVFCNAAVYPGCRAIITLNDGYYSTSPLSFYATEKEYEITTLPIPPTVLNSKGLATFSTRKDAIITTEGVTAYKAAVEGETITLTALDGYIPAGTGVILSGAAGTTIEYTTPAEGATAADVEGNVLKGTSKTDGTLAKTERNSWALNGNEFLYYTANEYQINKAYLVHGGYTAKSMNIVFDDYTTGISNANANADVKNAKFVENNRIVIMKNGVKYNAMGIKY